MNYQEKIEAAKAAVAEVVTARTGEDLKKDNVVVLFQDVAMEITKMICVDYTVGAKHGWMYKVTLDITKAQPATVEIFEKIA